MNLTTDAWIPIVWKSGKPGLVGLRHAFERGGEIQDLVLRPHERIAVMRLLICIAQAALDGPADYEDWKASRARIVPSALQYLAQWQQAFGLFGQGRAFLQVPNLTASRKSQREDDEGDTSPSKLDIALATGNNSTLFDNAGGSDRRFRHEQLALTLVTFQCFSPSGTIGTAKWDGVDTSGASDHAPCLADSPLHTLIRAGDLVTAIHRNLLTKTTCERLYGTDSWGKPVWEMMPQGAIDAAAVRNATRTYLGRLMPLARAIRIGDDGSSLTLANGLSYPSFDDGWREPTASVVTTKKGEEWAILHASIEKAIWRELPALTTRSSGQGRSGPASLQNFPDQDEAVDIWAGGLVCNKAKPLDSVESVFHIPARADLSTYQSGVDEAERLEWRLRRAVATYREALGDNRGFKSGARTHFWTSIERSVPKLIDVCEHGGIAKPEDWAGTDWGHALGTAARAAFERACPHDTPRQIRAWTLGLGALFGALRMRTKKEAAE